MALTLNKEPRLRKFPGSYEINPTSQLKSEIMKLRREYDGISLDIKVEGEKERRLAKQLER